MIIHHELAAEDVSTVAVIREGARAFKGKLRGPEGRVPFDATISARPGPSEVVTEPGTVGGIPGWWCRPPGARPDARLLYVHGGAFVMGTAKAFTGFASELALRARTDTFVVDYRLAPEHPFPAGFEDVVAAYRGLDDVPVIVAGDSAGGALSLALLAHTKGANLRGAAVFSPCTDLAGGSPSMETRAEADPIFTRDALASFMGHYLAGQDARDPRASPLFADLAGLPPVRIDVGDDEVLLDDSTRWEERATVARPS